MSAEKLRTTCCIAGGGPAGMMLGFLLARAGVPVVVLEKHKDFLRDFRGDTIHPSTLELMHELGLLEKFLALPHSQIDHLSMQFGAERVTIGGFDQLPTRCKYIALMPQWDFLNFLAAEAKKYDRFHLRMEAQATDLMMHRETVCGLRALTPTGELEIEADLIVGADGRHSIVRARAGLSVDELGAPMDVLWFRVSRRPSDGAEIFGHIETGRMMVMLNREDYWQCAYVISKGSAEAVKQKGLAAFRKIVGEMSPFLRDRLEEIKSWDDVKLLTVAVDRLRRWYRQGLLCIGDAAHAMSPIGGVGINLAVQDAVAAANILAEPLRARTVTVETLNDVQQRRMLPTRLIQAAQVMLQNRIIGPALAGKERLHVPLIMRIVQWPLLRWLPARLFGLGIRPEHIATAEVR